MSATPLQPDHTLSYMAPRSGQIHVRLSDLTPIRAIRAKCLDCSGGSAQEVRLCVIRDCPLYPYRLGKRPVIEGQQQKPKRTVAPEHLAKMQAARRKSPTGSVSLSSNGETDRTPRQATPDTTEEPNAKEPRL